MLADVADEFVDSAINLSRKIAVHRYECDQLANGLDTEQRETEEDRRWSGYGRVGVWDIQLALEKNWNLRFPQVPPRNKDGEISYVPTLPRQPTKAYLDKLAVVKRAKESGQERYTEKNQ